MRQWARGVRRRWPVLLVLALAAPACSGNPALLPSCPPNAFGGRAAPADPYGSDGRGVSGGALDQLTMTEQDTYLGVWWDQDRRVYVVAAADGADQADLAARFQPDVIEVRRVPHARSYYGPVIAALSPPQGNALGDLVTSFGVDAATQTFRIGLKDVSVASRREVSRRVPRLDGVCIEPDAQIFQPAPAG